MWQGVLPFTSAFGEATPCFNPSNHQKVQHEKRDGIRYLPARIRVGRPQLPWNLEVNNSPANLEFPAAMFSGKTNRRNVTGC